MQYCTSERKKQFQNDTKDKSCQCNNTSTYNNKTAK